MHEWLRVIKKLNRKPNLEIDPDEILIDSENLPRFDKYQFEGKLEKPVSRKTIYSVIIFFILILGIMTYRAFSLQVVSYDKYKKISEENILQSVPLFAPRGIISDRNGVDLAWNAPRDDINKRVYATTTGLSHILGYIQYPSKDKNGFYYKEDFEGVAGVEKYFDSKLKGKNGSRLTEVDAKGKVISENIIDPPIQGNDLRLTIDSRLQSSLYSKIKEVANEVGFEGGAGIIMDIRSGELLAMTSYPEYSSQIMSDREDSIVIKNLLNDRSLPFLNRAVDGLYTPGSIVKPYMAIAALNENIIDPSTIIVTTGSISIQNPYDKTKTSVFRDWKNLGPLDMRHAIAMSSDVYFYTIGGGYKDQKGLGILNIDKYLSMFGFGQMPSQSFAQGKAGIIPTPEWKKKTFNEDWYLGNTYHTSIGQYGFQVTLIQIARAVSAIANGGKILKPQILLGSTPYIERNIAIGEKYFNIVREGMRLGVIEGTSKNLNVPFVEIAGKSGTAELGVSKDKVNSWITGFWPYNNPKYAFVVMLEKGSVHNLIGAVAVMRREIDWIENNVPEYFD